MARLGLIPAVICIWAAFLFGESRPTGKNLLNNPGFEEGDFDPVRIPEGWYRSGDLEHATYQWSRHEGRKGSRCIYLAHSSEKAGLGHVTLPLDPGKTYMLGAWVKTRALEDGQVWIRAVAGGKDLTSRHYIIRAPASPDWAYYSVLLRDLDPRTQGVTVMIQLRDRAQGEAWVDDLFLGEAKIPPFKSPYPIPRLSGSRPEVKLKKTGFFRVEQHDGVWWFVTPQGRLFWSVGSNSTGGANPLLLEYLQNQPEARDLENTARVYITQQMERAADWGFNSLGAWSTLARHGFNIMEWNRGRMKKGKRPLYYFLSLNCANAGDSDERAKKKGFFLLNREGETQFQGQGHRMCDPFNPDWRSALEHYIARTVPAFKKDENCIGYFTDNEIFMGKIHDYLWAPHTLEAFIRLLQARHASTAALNQAWSSDRHAYRYPSLTAEALRSDPPDPYLGSPAMTEDLRAFETLLVGAYVDAVITTLRAHDPDHLVLCNRFGTMNADHLPLVAHFLPEFARFDVIAANLYPHPEQGEAAADFNGRKALAWITALHEITGRPILIGELGTASREAGVAVQRWSSRTVDTDAQRGASYKKIIYSLYNLPFTVGAHWFKWSNGYGFGSQSMQDPRNCGLIDDRNQPYRDLVIDMEKTHAAIEEAGRNPDFTLNDLPLPD